MSMCNLVIQLPLYIIICTYVYAPVPFNTFDVIEAHTIVYTKT